MSMSPVEGVALAEIESTGTGPEEKSLVGRSPGQLVWSRLRRDRTALVSGVVLALFVLLAVAAPLVQRLYGVSPNEQFGDLLDTTGMPLGYVGGVNADHWFGLEPGLGRDIFIRMIFGIRTSLLIALGAALVTATIGVVLGILAGYLGGVIDSVIGWVTDVALAMPFLVFALAVVPTFSLRFYGPRDAVPTWFAVTTLIVVFAAFGWTGTARLVRGQVVSLREREFVEAARASGAGLGHMLFRQLLPNIWAPILVSFSLAVPAYVTGEAALSFLGIGLPESVPSFGRMIYRSIDYLQTDPAYVFFPGITIFALVLAFNLFGDALRDALDPKSSR
ncbi:MULTISPECIES: ABC transporter permease [Micromonospora]|uniref:ABC transporter permease n=1 Tax=Micromonospora sicca TaxID=2202420 RepID=A0A317DKH9_9ACTN|nr:MULTISPECIES: ABC transporter permease [unclassified Micromonospora]MBM0228093.1 ABC transporter permease [Micromonospora sp. ATA51]MDZ5446629.1 ABC transporter permease [Micromonospora sp. 4G57]MDZ5490150.1 ABC transporter permease [Micromonospora sp. 4G53]PWR15127.1 ABC transporter permease [Micromonospora sp. 4G51]